ncbi:MAG: glycosyltransferase family 4 protein, partial [Candidatus Eremiobacteraeota bacterium]|nr:glycosyltransferase family 4 protein [Candidatus Eremiobacteraeota bacterium]
MSGAIDVALDVPRMRHMSIGMTAYAEELARRLPRVAPDLRFLTLQRHAAPGFDEQVRLPLRLLRLRPRLTHFLAVYAPLAAPRPFVITIHDLIHLRYPELFKRTIGPYYATVVRAVCARAARVITDDDRTIADLERFLGVAPRKVAVIALGVDEAFAQPVVAATEPRPYFLYVGNHRPHKDLPTLFAAWASLAPSFQVDLLLTGPDDLEREAQPAERAGGRVRFLGDVDAAHLARLYKGAVALVHPALCEGFGLPLLEAATVGTRVIVSSDAVPAVLRPYVEVFPTRDVRALGAAMARAVAQ